MKPQMSAAHIRQMRRSRAVYQTLRRGPSQTRLLAVEFALLAAVTLCIAGVIALRAWFAGGM